MGGAVLYSEFVTILRHRPTLTRLGWFYIVMKCTPDSEHCHSLVLKLYDNGVPQLPPPLSHIKKHYLPTPPHTSPFPLTTSFSWQKTRPYIMIQIIFVIHRRLGDELVVAPLWCRTSAMSLTVINWIWIRIQIKDTGIQDKYVICGEKFEFFYKWCFFVF